MSTCAHCGTLFEGRRRYCASRCKNAAGAARRRERNAASAERRCYRCKKVKSSAEFPAASSTYCRECKNSYQRQYLARQPAEAKAERRRKSYAQENPGRRAANTLRWRWGLTDEDLAARLAEQGGRCAICPATEAGGRGRWHVDHDHACCPRGRSCGTCIRGLLCTRCNVGLGNFRDSPDLLIAAAAYLVAAEERNAPG